MEKILTPEEFFESKKHPKYPTYESIGIDKQPFLEWAVPYGQQQYQNGKIDIIDQMIDQVQVQIQQQRLNIATEVYDIPTLEATIQMLQNKLLNETN